jgi:hypothetical protein
VTIVVNDTIGQSWSLTRQVVADADGRVTLTFVLPDYYVSDYDVTATGPVSGTARSTFTDAASGAWQYWLTASDPTAGNVAAGDVITYTLNARSNACVLTICSDVTGASMTLTLTGNATFAGGTKTFTWSPATLTRSGSSTTVTATVSSAASAGSTVVATIAMASTSTRGVLWTVSGTQFQTITHTVAAVVVNTCDFADAGSGAYASSICWFDLTGYSAATAANRQRMQQNLPGGYKLSYTIKVGSSDAAAAAKGFPTWSGSYLGNTSSGVGGYYGVSGMPAIYQSAGGTTTLDLTDIALTDPSGTKVSGFALVGADAESTDGGESITWTSSSAFTSIGPLGNSCGGSLTWSNGNKTVTCTGPSNVGNKTGTAILYSQDPTTFSQSMVGGGLQGVAFGIIVSGVQLKKTVVNPVTTSDGFSISVATGGTTLSTRTANAASGWTADTGQVYWIIAGSSQTFTLSEAALNPTDAANYAVTWACTKNGATYSPSGSSATTKTVTVTSFADFIVCEITNTGPSVTLRKSVDNAAGGSLTPAAWTLTATGSAATVSKAPVAPWTVNGTLTTGSTATTAVPIGGYALAESSTATGSGNYTAGTWACTKDGTAVSIPNNVVTLAAGDNVICSITNTYRRSVTVRKTWVNGVSGDKADLAINGATASPGKATSTANGTAGSWTDTTNVATALPTAGSTVSVAETLASANVGKYTSALACVDGNNNAVTVTNGAFTMPSAAVVCTFTNTGVKPTVAVWKTTAGAFGGPFPFTLTNTTPTTGTVTTTAAGTRTQVDTDAATSGAQPFTIASFGVDVTIDEATSSMPAGWMLVSATCSNGTTTVGSLTGTKYTIPAASLIAGAAIICDVTNRPMAGTVTWSKVDAGSTATLLKGSAWTLTALTGPAAPTSLAVADCVAETSAFCTGADKDPAAGSFSVPGVFYGSYNLVETASPAGFQLDATPHPISVTVDGSTAVIGAITNKRVPVPAIPLTGGPSTDGFLISGVLLLALAAAAAWRQRRRLIQHPRI